MKNLLASGVLLSSFAASLVLVLDSPAAAQGSGSSRLNQPPPARSNRPAPAYPQPAPTYVPRGVAPPQTPEVFQQALWRYLIRPQSPYTQWSPLPDKAGLRKGASPHGAFVRLYANGVATVDPKNLPYGSILVLEDYAEDQRARTGINILYRVKGYDPKNGDWYWMKYNENGAVVRTSAEEGSRPIAGRALGCVECHRKAAGNDFVFSNDPAEEPPTPGDDEKGGAKRKDLEEKGEKAPPGGMTFGRDWPAADRIALDAVDHRAWDVLLKRYVDAAGNVNYAAWRLSEGDLGALDDYLKDLSRVETGRDSTRAARLAFWINAYNALTARAVLSGSRTGVVRDDAALPSERSAPLLRVGDHTYTADRIEDEVLRKMGESRIHFAIVCGARGCPRLRSEAYRAGRLEAQLNANARAFFADPSKFRAHAAEGRLELSPILDWYAADFGADTGSRLKAIAPYLPDEASRRLAASGRARVSHLGYDDRLNETTAPRTTRGSSGDGGH